MFLATRPGLTLIVLAVLLAWPAYWAIVCAFVAREKERDVWGWAGLGFVFGPLAFLPLAVVPDLTEYAAQEVQVVPPPRRRRGVERGARENEQ